MSTHSDYTATHSLALVVKRLGMSGSSGCTVRPNALIPTTPTERALSCLLIQPKLPDLESRSMHESADKTLHRYSRMNHWRLLCNNTLRNVDFSAQSLISNKPPLFLCFSIIPFCPIRSHTDPLQPCSVLSWLGGTPRTAGIPATWHTCGMGSIQDAYSWEDSKSERDPELVKHHPGRLEEARSSCLQPLGCDAEVHAAGQPVERSLPGIH